ncbi:MAG: hypothetical protein NDI62_01920 [Burkholderiales bacterium]|nr:hypothetical protein [Burkholderiales bacterium]
MRKTTKSDFFGGDGFPVLFSENDEIIFLPITPSKAGEEKKEEVKNSNHKIPQFAGPIDRPNKLVDHFC